MNAPLYTIDILRLAASVPEAVKLERVDGSARRRSPTCGSVVEVEVQLDAGGRVQALSQRVEACAFGQAATAIMASHAAGRNRRDVEAAAAELRCWLAGERDDPGAWPGLTALAPARARKSRHGAILLPFTALLAAMDNGR